MTTFFLNTTYKMSAPCSCSIAGCSLCEDPKWKHCLLEASDTIESLKSKLLTHSTDQQQRLIFNGKQLEDSCTFSDYNIHSESKLLLLLGSPDGMRFSIETPDGEMIVKIEACGSIERAVGTI